MPAVLSTAPRVRAESHVACLAIACTADRFVLVVLIIVPKWLSCGDMGVPNGWQGGAYLQSCIVRNRIVQNCMTLVKKLSRISTGTDTAPCALVPELRR